MLFSSTSLYASTINPFDDQINKCLVKNISEDPRVCLVNEQISSQNHFDTSDKDKVLQTVTRSKQIVYESNYLAPHIWKTIFLYLDKAALKSCRAVSRLFAGIILNTQNHPAHSFILKLSTISDFTAYLSHNRQYSLRGINITFAINDDTFVDKDLSHLVFLSGHLIGDAGATALAGGNLTNLTSLNLRGNGMSDLTQQFLK